MTEQLNQTINHLAQSESKQSRSHNSPPELLKVDCATLGDHGAHWEILTDNINVVVPKWLEHSIDDAVMPRGLAFDVDPNTDDQAAHWLITGPEGTIQVAQILDVKDGRPTAVRSAYPFLDSKWYTEVRVSRVLHCEHSLEAVLTLETSDGATLYAFDALYAVNQHRYQSKVIYHAYLGAFAYEIERVGSGETIVVDDPAAIRHHRALNEILANNNGVAPDDLQEKLAAWQAKTPDDEAPVTLDLSNMVAYLFGENFGQEDEAWFQGEVLGVQPLNFMSEAGQLLDVVILREPDAKPLIIQIAYFPRGEAPANIQAGEFIRGNIWLQAAVYAPIERM
ncbi:hypothetical protein [Aquirhabdus parva]|uniref:Uncharacterized protein n=1 Tax=Aquirhabdus parva TaxID=2283318 RepID=A0A345P5H8_9GAMM|nr:hypothetical protein [Aquirhabdus parva]AXI02537.1 hypothetical protein HYN46_06670 [Aquirhabdus parva]